jgi:hypothetical protein
MTMGDNSATKRFLVHLFRLAKPANAGGALFAHAIIWLFATAFYVTQNIGARDAGLFALPIGLGFLSLLTMWVGLDLAREYRPIKLISTVACAAWLLLAGLYLVRRGPDIVLAATDDVGELGKLTYLVVAVAIQIAAVVASFGPLAASPIRTRWRQLVRFKEAAFGLTFRAWLSLLIFFGASLAFHALMENSSLAIKYGDYGVMLLGAAVVVVGLAIIAVIALRPLKVVHDADYRMFIAILSTICISAATGNVMSEYYWDYRFSSLSDAGAQARELRGLIAQDPDNVRLYWQLAPVYLRMRQPISALLVISVYYQVLGNDKYQSFLEKIRPQFYGLPYLGQDEIRKALKRSSQELVKLNAAVMADRPVRLVDDFEPNQIFQAAANAGGSALNIDAIELSVVGSSSCAREDLPFFDPHEPRAKSDAKVRILTQCREAFQGASLQRAVISGVADITRPGCLHYDVTSSGHIVINNECPDGGEPYSSKPDPNCCSLALDDPDLRLLRNVDAVVVKLDANKRAAFLAVATRMLFKQQYLLNYIVCAPQPKRTSCRG